MCGDIHKRGTLNFKEVKEINEDDLDKYLKMGWEIDE
jgi:hypothetical protein